MTSLFLDTGYIIALEAANDQNHKIVSKHWQTLSKSMQPLVTTSYVFDEIVTFFNSRNRNVKAVEIGNRLLTSQTIKLVHVDEALFFEGWNLLVQRDDKMYSLTDCISFSVMKKFDIQTALALDKHFVQEGFLTLP